MEHYEVRTLNCGCRDCWARVMGISGDLCFACVESGCDAYAGSCNAEWERRLNEGQTVGVAREKGWGRKTLIGMGLRFPW